jgi:hypothetical protein
MAHDPRLIDVLTVIETRKIAHGAHPTQSTKANPPAAQEEDVTQCIGKAQLMEVGTLHVQLKAIPLNGRLIIRLPR